MATIRADNELELRTTLHAGNGRKGLALLLWIAAVGAALLLVPALRGAPDTESQVHLPAMSNVPPAGNLQLETHQP